MEIDSKCYKIDINSTRKSESRSTVTNSPNEFQNLNDFPKKRYQIIKKRRQDYQQLFLIKNLETGNTKEFNYAEVKLYFYNESIYMDFMQLKSKNKSQKE